MENIYVLVEFKLNDKNLMEDWKKMSAGITADISKADGFISRESAVDSEGNVYCIVKWENIEKQKAFRKYFEEVYQKENPEIMEAFGKIVDVTTMARKTLEVL